MTRIIHGFLMVLHFLCVVALAIFYVCIIPAAIIATFLLCISLVCYPVVTVCCIVSIVFIYSLITHKPNETLNK